MGYNKCANISDSLIFAKRKDLEPIILQHQIPESTSEGSRAGKRAGS